MEKYDKRHGWRGVLGNIKKKEWFDDVKELSIDKNLKWKLARVVEVNKLLVKIETQDNESGFIDFKNTSWTRKKSFDEFININDVIFISLGMTTSVLNCWEI